MRQMLLNSLLCLIYLKKIVKLGKQRYSDHNFFRIMDKVIASLGVPDVIIR